MNKKQIKKNQMIALRTMEAHATSIGIDMTKFKMVVAHDDGVTFELR